MRILLGIMASMNCAYQCQKYGLRDIGTLVCSPIESASLILHYTLLDTLGLGERHVYEVEK